MIVLISNGLEAVCVLERLGEKDVRIWCEEGCRTVPVVPEVAVLRQLFRRGTLEWGGVESRPCPVLLFHHVPGAPIEIALVQAHSVV